MTTVENSKEKKEAMRPQAKSSTRNDQTTIVGLPLPNISSEERSAGSSKLVRRSRCNPIIPHNFIPTSNSIFNSEVGVYDTAATLIDLIEHPNSPPRLVPNWSSELPAARRGYK